ncbi:YbbR-like domain-containing protein [Patescibacteria group bacterium]
MKRLLGNFELKILAILAAVIFWFLIVGTENNFYTLPDEIGVKAFNVPEEFVVAEDLGNVKLRLKLNTQEAAKGVKPGDFDAYIDLEGVSEGERDIEVSVSSKNSDVSVLKIEPSSIRVKIEKKAEKEVPIVQKVEGDVKEGYVIKNIDFVEENAILKGPQKALNDLNEVSLVIALDSESKDIRQLYPLKVFDEEGEELSNILVDPKEIEVEVEIGPSTGQKIVGVQPSVIGTPPENVWIKSINVEPSVIVLSGDPEKINTIEFVSTEEIQVDSLTESNSYTVSLTGIPDGVSIESGSQVTVSVEVEKYATEASSINRKTVNVPIVIMRFRTDQNSKSVSPPSVTLVAEGAEDALNKLSSKLTVELDISDYENEKDEAKIQLGSNHFSLPDGVTMVNVSPSEVKVSW